MEGIEYDNYDDYTPDNDTDASSNLSISIGTFGNRPERSRLTDFLLVTSIVICVLGLAGNGLVIWICGWKMKRTVNTTWFLSLAISNFVFCACLPLDIVYAISSHWPFGLALCKLTSFSLFLNMFSSIFLLVLISVDRCLLVQFPVWSQNHRTVRKASIVVVLLWLVATALTAPVLLYRQTKVHDSATQCYTDYKGHSTHTRVVLTRFTCGFLIPFLLILSCCSLLCVKLRSMTVKSTKPYKVMALLILTFFFCWVPYHTFVLYELNLRHHRVEVVEIGLKVGGTLAAANSLINPIVYVFIGNDFQRTVRKSFMSRIENAMAEDIRFSRSKSVDI